MHSLKPITLDLKPAVDRLFEIENSRSADFCFGNVYMWDKRFKQSVTLCGDRLVTLLHRKGEQFFAFPVGKNKVVVNGLPDPGGLFRAPAVFIRHERVDSMHIFWSLLIVSSEVSNSPRVRKSFERESAVTSESMRFSAPPEISTYWKP